MFNKGTKVTLQPFWHGTSDFICDWMKRHQNETFIVKASWGKLVTLEGVDFGVSENILKVAEIL